MVRPLRINYPGACYHITSRGNERKPDVTLARNVKINLCQKYTGEKLRKIVEQFGISESGYTKVGRVVVG